MFRNYVVHKPTTISYEDLMKNIQIIKQITKEIKL